MARMSLYQVLIPTFMVQQSRKLILRWQFTPGGLEKKVADDLGLI